MVTGLRWPTNEACWSRCGTHRRLTARKALWYPQHKLKARLSVESCAHKSNTVPDYRRAMQVRVRVQCAASACGEQWRVLAASASVLCSVRRARSSRATTPTTHLQLAPPAIKISVAMGMVISKVAQQGALGQRTEGVSIAGHAVDAWEAMVLACCLVELHLEVVRQQRWLKCVHCCSVDNKVASPPQVARRWWHCTWRGCRRCGLHCT